MAFADDTDDPLGSLPTDFASFALEQKGHGGAKAEPFETQRQYKTRLCCYGDSCPYGPARCFFAHDPSELRPPMARWWLPEYKTKPCRYSAAECPFYADGRCQYAHTVDELQLSRGRGGRAGDASRRTRSSRGGSRHRRGARRGYS